MQIKKTDRPSVLTFLQSASYKENYLFVITVGYIAYSLSSMQGTLRGCPHMDNTQTSCTFSYLNAYSKGISVPYFRFIYIYIYR